MTSRSASAMAGMRRCGIYGECMKKRWYGERVWIGFARICATSRSRMREDAPLSKRISCASFRCSIGSMIKKCFELFGGAMDAHRDCVLRLSDDLRYLTE